jgi:hypothetical protein
MCAPFKLKLHFTCNRLVHEYNMIMVQFSNIYFTNDFELTILKNIYFFKIRRNTYRCIITQLTGPIILSLMYTYIIPNTQANAYKYTYMYVYIIIKISEFVCCGVLVSARLCIWSSS